MLSFLGSALANFLTNIFKTWFAEHQAETLGATKQTLAIQVKTNELTSQAQAARDAVKLVTADSLPNIKSSSDPDFRD